LPLKIGKIDIVEIDDPDRANAGSRQIKRGRRSEASGPDTQDARSFEPILPLGCNLGHDEMTRIPLQFFNIQSHRAAALVVNDAPIHGGGTLAQSVAGISVGKLSASPASYSVTFTGVPTGEFS
jgi:hypothetical protein